MAHGGNTTTLAGLTMTFDGANRHVSTAKATEIGPAGWLYSQIGPLTLGLLGFGVVRVAQGHLISGALLVVAGLAVGSVLLDKLTLVDGTLTERRGGRRRSIDVTEGAYVTCSQTRWVGPVATWVPVGLVWPWFPRRRVVQVVTKNGERLSPRLLWSVRLFGDWTSYGRGDIAGLKSSLRTPGRG